MPAAPHPAPRPDPLAEVDDATFEAFARALWDLMQAAAAKRQAEQAEPESTEVAS
jgi:hypothetical protein